MKAQNRAGINSEHYFACVLPLSDENVSTGSQSAHILEHYCQVFYRHTTAQIFT